MNRIYNFKPATFPKHGSLLWLIKNTMFYIRKLLFSAVIEISHDAGTLRQSEVNLLHLCGNTDLFVPTKSFKVRLHNNFFFNIMNYNTVDTLLC